MAESGCCQSTYLDSLRLEHVLGREREINFSFYYTSAQSESTLPSIVLVLDLEIEQKRLIAFE